MRNIYKSPTSGVLRLEDKQDRTEEIGRKIRECLQKHIINREYAAAWLARLAEGK